MQKNQMQNSIDSMTKRWLQTATRATRHVGYRSDSEYDSDEDNFCINTFQPQEKIAIGSNYTASPERSAYLNSDVKNSAYEKLKDEPQHIWQSTTQVEILDRDEVDQITKQVSDARAISERYIYEDKVLIEIPDDDGLDKDKVLIEIPDDDGLDKDKDSGFYPNASVLDPAKTQTNISTSAESERKMRKALLKKVAESILVQCPSGMAFPEFDSVQLKASAIVSKS